MTIEEIRNFRQWGSITAGHPEYGHAEGIEVTNLHQDYAVIAVQGPQSDEVLQALELPVGHDYMQFREGSVDGRALTICRTGYTGEDGVECAVPVEVAEAFWSAVTATGVAPLSASITPPPPRRCSCSS